jgi:hypothetical protein
MLVGSTCPLYWMILLLLITYTFSPSKRERFATHSGKTSSISQNAQTMGFINFIPLFYTHKSMAISGTYINWRYLVPIPYVRPKLSGNIPTIHMANKMCPAAMAGSPPSIMSSWCLGWCSDLVGTVVLDESPVTTAWKPPLFRDI